MCTATLEYLLYLGTSLKSARYVELQLSILFCTLYMYMYVLCVCGMVPMGLTEQVLGWLTPGLRLFKLTCMCAVLQRIDSASDKCSSYVVALPIVSFIVSK